MSEFITRWNTHINNLAPLKSFPLCSWFVIVGSGNALNVRRRRRWSTYLVSSYHSVWQRPSCRIMSEVKVKSETPPLDSVDFFYRYCDCISIVNTFANNNNHKCLVAYFQSMCLWNWHPGPQNQHRSGFTMYDGLFDISLIDLWSEIHYSKCLWYY